MSLMGEWFELVRSNREEKIITERLRNIYLNYKPKYVSFTPVAHCPNSCKHCIYPPDYYKYNKEIQLKLWIKIIKDLYHKGGKKIFICNGRSFNQFAGKIIENIKYELPGIKIGIIIDGYCSVDYIKQFNKSYVDWIDISIDGNELIHDSQRERKGSYKQAIKCINILKNDKYNKIGVLCCLTTININYALDSIVELNKLGLKRFCISPVSVVNNLRPSMNLLPSCEDVFKLIFKIKNKLSKLSGVWIGIDLFDHVYAMELMKYNVNNMNNEWKLDDNSISWQYVKKCNTFSINYIPFSMCGTTEMNINCNGDMLLPLSMAYGEVPTNFIIGSCLKSSASDLLLNFPLTKKFNFYKEIFFKEKKFWNKGLL